MLQRLCAWAVPLSAKDLHVWVTGHLPGRFKATADCIVVFPGSLSKLDIKEEAGRQWERVLAVTLSSLHELVPSTDEHIVKYTGEDISWKSPEHPRGIW